MPQEVNQSTKSNRSDPNYLFNLMQLMPNLSTKMDKFTLLEISIDSRINNKCLVVCGDALKAVGTCMTVEALWTLYV